MIKPKLKGKQVKDYLFGDSLAVYEQGSEVAKAIKSSSIQLTVYGIANQLIDPQSFPIYNNQIATNTTGIYPAYYEIVRSQNFLYMIFEQLVKPAVELHSQSILKFAKQLQKLLILVPSKLQSEYIFMKTKTKQLCVILPYTKNLQQSNNLYSKYHNKSILAQFFCSLIPITDKNKVIQIFIQNAQSKDLYQKLQPFLNIGNKHKKQTQVIMNKLGNMKQTHSIPMKTNVQPPHKQIKKQTIQNKPIIPSNNITKSNANKLIKQMQSEYPDIDEKEYEQLMAYVHVNPNLKHQAGQAYMRQSAKVRKDEAENEITEIVNNVNTSLFNITNYKTKDGKSKVEIKLNLKKMEITEFQVHFDAYYSSFKLFKMAIRSYLQKYRNGFAGIIAAYLITLISILRKLKFYSDLSMGVDVFEIGGQVQNMNFEKFTNIIRKQLANQARNLATLKNIIENANMPYKTYQALTPYLEQDLELVDLSQTQNFCFFYMTILLRMNQNHSFHQILALQVMYVLISPFYSIVFSQEEMPKLWDPNYFELRKVLISTLIPQWQI